MNSKNTIVSLPKLNCHNFSETSVVRRFERQTTHGCVRGLIELTDDYGNVEIGAYDERSISRINMDVNPEVIDLTGAMESVPDSEGTTHTSPSADEVLAFHTSLCASWVEPIEARRSPELIDLTEMDKVSSDSEDCHHNPEQIPPHRRSHSLKCPICCIKLCEADTAMATSCGHLFCKTCITTSISIRVICPICNKNLYGEKLTVIFIECECMSIV